jgi:hypothetical protein
MTIISSMLFMIALMPELILAAEKESVLAEQNIRVITSKVLNAELQLETKQAPIAKVLDSVANKTGVRINYSALPDGLVTATCVGSSVKQVLECVLDRKADIVLRYSEQPVKEGQPKIAEEIWVLGAKIGADKKNSVACELPANRTIVASESDKTDELIKMAMSKSPTERAEAIGRLMAGGRKGDATVRETLEVALSDPDARVRVQAISSLAHREGTGASAALQEAIHDRDVSVRLTAIDNAGDDKDLLRQALTDSDFTVRQLAKIRLDSLTKEGPRKILLTE